MPTEGFIMFMLTGSSHLQSVRYQNKQSALVLPASSFSDSALSADTLSQSVSTQGVMWIAVASMRSHFSELYHKHAAPSQLFPNSALIIRYSRPQVLYRLNVAHL
jgi:hypothetical protein